MHLPVYHNRSRVFALLAWLPLYHHYGGVRKMTYTIKHYG
jgi:hypothetical protein